MFLITFSIGNFFFTFFPVQFPSILFRYVIHVLCDKCVQLWVVVCLFCVNLFSYGMNISFWAVSKMQGNVMRVEYRKMYIVYTKNILATLMSNPIIIITWALMFPYSFLLLFFHQSRSCVCVGWRVHAFRQLIPVIYSRYVVSHGVTKSFGNIVFRIFVN